MVDLSQIGGKTWQDKTGLTSKFNAANMNAMRPRGFVFGDPLAPLKAKVLPQSWNNNGAVQVFPGGEVTVNPSKTTYVYLDGAQAPAAQLVQNETGFPAANAGFALLLAEIDSDATSITAIRNMNVLTGPFILNGGISSVGASAPLQSTGGQNPVISIPPSSAAGAGSMSAADFAKLAGITAPVEQGLFATPGSIIQGADPGPGPIPLALGSALQLLRVNQAAKALEYFTAKVFNPELLVLHPTAVSNDAALGFVAYEFAEVIRVGANFVEPTNPHRITIATPGKYLVFAQVNITANGVMDLSLLAPAGSANAVLSLLDAGPTFRNRLAVGAFDFSAPQPLPADVALKRNPGSIDIFQQFLFPANIVVIVKVAD